MVNQTLRISIWALNLKDLEPVEVAQMFNQWALLHNTAAVRLIFMLMELVQVLQLSRRESNIKTEKLVSDNTSKANS